MPRPRGWTGDATDLEEVLRLAADPITVQDADGRVVYANEAAARHLGFASIAELLATPSSELLARYVVTDGSGMPLERDELPGRRALRGEREPGGLVGFQIRGDPEVRWSIIRATPVLQDGSVRYVINAFQEISTLKRAEDRLRILADAGAVLADTDDYQGTLQALAELIVPRLADWCVVDVVERSGLRGLAVAHPDPEKRASAEDLQRRYPPDLERTTGVGEVIRSGVAQVIPTITDEMLRSAAQDASHLGLLRGLGLRSAAIVPLIARGQVLGALTLAGGESGHTFDDADLPFLQELARRAALAVDNARLLHEATEAIRLRDEFLAMASHDMRTPLQAILANLQLATRRVARANTDGRVVGDDLTNNLLQAEHTTARLTRLVSDLLDVAMLRSGHAIPIELADADLGDLARRVAAEHQAGTDRHRIEVSGQASRVTSDARRIERVLDNLVENAVKYSPDGGEVRIELRDDNELAIISVADEGVGIPSEDLEAIFTPYHRASNVATMPGIGLGLAGSREVLRHLGGDLTVQSRVGAGSTFVASISRSFTA